jgi:hypothetical protein
MRWPSKDEDVSEIRLLADVIKKHSTNEAVNTALIVKWCVERYRPESKYTALGAQQDGIDSEVAIALGITEDSTEYAMITLQHPMLDEIMLDVFLAVGEAEWLTYCVGLVAVRNAFKEVMATLTESDEDKRAGIHEKKLKVLELAEARFAKMQAWAAHAFSDSDVATRVAGRKKWEVAAWRSNTDDE